METVESELCLNAQCKRKTTDYSLKIETIKVYFLEDGRQRAEYMMWQWTCRQSIFAQLEGWAAMCLTPILSRTSA